MYNNVKICKDESMNIYFIGINDLILQSENNFLGSITVQRRFETKNNICFSDLYPDERIDYNKISDLKRIDKFFIEAVKMVLKKDKDAYFLRYNEHNLKGYNLKKYHILSVNTYSMYDYVNNKFKIREDLKPYTNILDYKFLLGVELEKYFLKVWQNKKTFSLSFVVQEEYGFAGENTFIFTKENLKNQLKLIKKHKKYCISVLQENCKSYNIHLFVDNDFVEYFAPSQQIINKTSDKMCYDGADYNISKEISNKILTESKGIGEYLKQIGYRGVCGIDYILVKDTFYFMEINARFQTSTMQLNKQLSEKHKKTLFDRQINLAIKGVIK